MADTNDEKASAPDKRDIKTAAPNLPKTKDTVATKAALKAGHLQDKTASAKQHVTQKKEEKQGPSGGFDDTPVPTRPPGYTVKITFHRATNLPIADINSLSSDPYILAILQNDLPTRSKSDPPIVLRTPTIRRSTSPEWNCDWILCNVPSSGFLLKARVFDEDPADHDDRLGNVHVHVNNVSEKWAGIKEESFSLRKRMASKRAYLLQALTACVNKQKPMTGQLVVSVQVLGRTKDTGGGKIYTLGPCAWSQHFSPMIGRMVGVKDPTKSKDGKKEQESYK
jgi:C2 domain